MIIELDIEEINRIRGSFIHSGVTPSGTFFCQAGRMSEKRGRKNRALKERKRERKGGGGKQKRGGARERREGEPVQ